MGASARPVTPGQLHSQAVTLAIAIAITSCHTRNRKQGGVRQAQQLQAGSHWVRKPRQGGGEGEGGGGRTRRVSEECLPRGRCAALLPRRKSRRAVEQEHEGAARRLREEERRRVGEVVQARSWSTQQVVQQSARRRQLSRCASKVLASAPRHDDAQQSPDIFWYRV